MPDMDKILIEGLLVETRIGVYDWERLIQQPLVFDLELDTDIAAAASSDDLSETIDYKALSDRVVDYVSGTEFELLEALAENLAALILKEFGVSHLRMKVSKPGAVPKAENVSLLIERSANEDSNAGGQT